MNRHSIYVPWPAVRKWLPSRGNVLFTLLVLASLFFAGRAGAIPGLAPADPSGASTGLIAYQGRLADMAGTPLTGSYAMTFALYTAPTGGTALWAETQTVSAADGTFSAMLGNVTPIPPAVASNPSLYLGVKVGSDVEMTPRKQLGSTAYAFQAIAVQDGAITTAKLADGAVTQAKPVFDIEQMFPYNSLWSLANRTQPVGTVLFSLKRSTRRLVASA